MKNKQNTVTSISPTASRIGVGVALALCGAVMSTARATPASFNENQSSVDNAISKCSNFYNQQESNAPSACNIESISDLKSLTPDQVFGMGSIATRVNGGKNSLPFGQSGKINLGGGAGDGDFSKLSFWGKVDSSFGLHDNTALNLGGFKFDNHNFMAGADYRISDRWSAGAAFNYKRGNATFNSGRGETLSDNYIGTLYSSYFITDALHVEGTASYGGVDFETSRNIKLGGTSSIASAAPSADQYAFSLGGGYDFNFKALTVAPYARGEYTGLDIDSYSETGSPGAVRFGKQNIQSLISTVGVQTAYSVSVPWGVVIPQLRGEWHHQFMDGRRQVTGSFVADGSGSTFTLVNDAPSRDYYTFGAEVSSVLPGGVSAFLSYETLQGYRHIDSNRFMLGGRMEF
ncbi:autotransporter outer membrane beta-barrel domain-containing protein [Methylomonas sp. UP202]|uniref:autotransporter outer membrane beta-barrel domain-containing protein n=1 Tax=Methylomonas sp. UP202 TaxID=3040943 RepID=UPI00247A87C3|nr:autotransporter outer membrane beta-barrel domain-containing protein [Methylomonas sp. UP202]WGS84697.1 autotransporter outer membrane beta-barrel domain-containing protein [Methylomonas sp. UP202]